MNNIGQAQFEKYSPEFLDGETRRITYGNLKNPESGDVIRVVAISLRPNETSLEEIIFESEKEKITRLNNLPHRSPYIAQCIGFSVSSIFMELGSLALEKFLPKLETQTTTPFLERAAQNICEAVVFLHENGFAHGCINPAHIVINGGVAKLIDFKYLSSVGDPYQVIINRHFCFAPPEAWFAAATQTRFIPEAPPELAQQGDIFQLGVTLLHCLNYPAVPNFVSAENTPLGWYDPNYAMNQFQYMVTCYEQRPLLDCHGFLSLEPKNRIDAKTALGKLPFLKLLPPEVPADPTFDFQATNLGQDGAFKSCTIGTIVWNNERVAVSKLTMRKRHNNPRKSLLDDNERRLLLRIDKKNNSYFPKIYHLGRSILFFEACDCDFATLIDTNNTNPVSGKKYSRVELEKLLSDIFKGVALLHEMGVVHYDIKSPNALVQGDNGKLIDLGHARELGPGPQQVIWGTVLAAPPEALNAYFNKVSWFSSDHPAKSDDIWRLGILALELLHPAARNIFIKWNGKMNNFHLLPRADIDAYYSDIFAFVYTTPDFQYMEHLQMDPNHRKMRIV